jgi:hypothetical protein
MNEEAIKLASKFIESRELLRRLFGKKYDAECEPYRAAIRAIMKLKDYSEVEAVKHILRTAKQDSVPHSTSGVLAMWVLSAALDVSEGATPSEG